MTDRHTRLAIFVALSMAMHGVLLVNANTHEQAAAIPPTYGNLAVTLVQSESRTDRQIETPVQKSHSAHPTRVREKAAKTPTSTNSNQDPNRATQDPAQASNLVKHELKTKLLAHFEYPLLAVRHGWQGDVQLSFRVQANGDLINIRVERSSGYALLDRSAMEALRRVNRVRDSLHWLQGNPLDLSLPIRYQLREG